MQTRTSGALFLIVAAVILAWQSMFQVRETEVAIRMQFGKIVGTNYKPGLHLKWPLWIDNVRRFERRIVTQRYEGETFLTSENKALIVDFYVKWRVRDAAQYYRAANGNADFASKLLGENVKDGIKSVVARRTLQEIVITERTVFTGDMFSRASASVNELGVELIDVRVQRIDLQEEVATSVYESMKRTFEGIARTRRGEGDRESQIVKAEAERKKTELIARALADAQRIRGEGDATAAAIYATAYNRNPEFYSFYRSLQAYKNSLGKEGDVMVVSPDSDFYRYFKSPAPNRR